MPPFKKSKKVLKRIPFKFDGKKILEERRRDQLNQRSKESEEREIIINDLYQKAVQEVNDINNGTRIEEPELEVIDNSNYNIPFNNNESSDVTKYCLERFVLMSIEKRELLVTVHYFYLIKTSWQPEFNDFQCVLNKWGIDIDGLIDKPQIYNNFQVSPYNLKYIYNFLNQRIRKNQHKFNPSDLLTLAKVIAAISLNDHFGQRINELKELFNTCIESALHENNEADIVTFAQDLFSTFEGQLSKITVELFLPLKDQIMKKIYTYLTYKLFKSLIGKPDNPVEFPTSSNEWFVQDLVERTYFDQNPKDILNNLIHLLEHVVIVFDLYENENKMMDMYYFLYSLLRPSFMSGVNEQNILDQWKLQLFRLHFSRNVNFLT